MPHVHCVRCDGKGLVSSWSFGVKEPDECPDCCGAGVNWQYDNGMVARYRGGPFVGRASIQPRETSHAS